MGLPFSVDQFFGVFRTYNEAAWPAPVILEVLGIAGCGLALWPSAPRWRRTAVASALAVLWIWTGLIYLLLFFAPINPPALVFALLFVVQAVLFVWQGTGGRRFRFGRAEPRRLVEAVLLMAFAFVGYPLWGSMAGHHFPAAPTFGTPCPTTIATLGILLLIERPWPRMLFVIPLLWAVVGTTAALLLGVPQDLGLGAAGLVVLAEAFVGYASPRDATDWR